MSSAQKALARLRASPNNADFEELCRIVERLGYVRRGGGAGSHRFFKHPTAKHLPPINLQPTRSGTAKPYQVRQVLDIIDTYGLADGD